MEKECLFNRVCILPNDINLVASKGFPFTDGILITMN